MLLGKIEISKERGLLCVSREGETLFGAYFISRILSFPAYARDATALRRDAEIWGAIELFARTSFQSASQPQFSLDIVDV